RGIAGAAAVAGKKHLPPVLPAVAQFGRETLDRRPIEPAKRSRQPLRVSREVLRRRRSLVHRTTVFSIHLRLYQRSSFDRRPCEYMPISSLMASSTVFFGRKPVF